MTAPTTINVLVEREGDWWVAQCLQFDLAIQVRKLDDIHDEIKQLLIAHVVSCEDDGIEPFQIPPANRNAWTRYELARTSAHAVSSRSQEPPRTLQHALPNVEIRIAG